MRKVTAAGLVAVATAISALLGSANAAAAAAPGCDAILYRDAGFLGPSQRIAGDQPSLRPDMLRQASSLRIAAGRWTFFAEPSYGGASLSYGVGDSPRVPAEWNDRISSARCTTDVAQTSPDVAPVPIGAAPYFLGGQPYGWYDAGWNGAGFYVVGTQLLRGRGFGGREGWHGWHRSFWYRYHHRFAQYARGDGDRRLAPPRHEAGGGRDRHPSFHPVHFPGGQGGFRPGGGPRGGHPFGQGGHRAGAGFRFGGMGRSGGRGHRSGGGHGGGGRHR